MLYSSIDACPADKDESVAVGPDGLGGIKTQEPLPEGVGDRGGAHDRAGVPGFGRLYGVNPQRADRVHAELIERLRDGVGDGPG